MRVARIHENSELRIRPAPSKDVLVYRRSNCGRTLEIGECPRFVGGTRLR